MKSVLLTFSFSRLDDSHVSPEYRLNRRASVITTALDRLLIDDLEILFLSYWLTYLLTYCAEPLPPGTRQFRFDDIIVCHVMLLRPTRPFIPSEYVNEPPATHSWECCLYSRINAAVQVKQCDTHL